MAVPAPELQRTRDEKYRWVPQSCPVCQIPPTKFLGRRGGKAHREGLGVECEVWRCDRCGLIFPHPMPIPIGGIGQHYAVEPDEFFQHHQIDTKNVSANELLRRAEEITGGKGKLLDIGAGRGELLRAAREQGWCVTGIEVSARFADYAAEYSGLAVRRNPVEDCDFEVGSFDAVVLSAVLEHLYNPNETIREIARILRTGGALFVDVPNEAGLYFHIGNFYQRLRGRNWVVNLAPTFSPFHVFGFTPGSLRALLAKHSLRPVDWHVYAGRAVVPSRHSLMGGVERLAAQAVTALSKVGSLGAYIETWAIRI